jgi:hypothetical protein
MACCGFALVAAMAVCGCNGKSGTVTVNGTVVRGGKPIALGPTGALQVTLKPDVGPDQEYMLYGGSCDNSGKFEILEVPPGNYIVGVEILDPDPISDQLGGALSVRAGKIKRLIDGKAPLSIDVAKPE